MGKTTSIPPRLLERARQRPQIAVWLDRLPDALRAIVRRWSLVLDLPFDNDSVSCAWVAPVELADGTRAVLKLGMPHMEAQDEMKGLRFWNGDGIVRVLQSDDDSGAMLLERCEPGTALRQLPEPEQDVIIAGLLRRLWRPAQTFRPLSQMLEHWSAETLGAQSHWPDAALVREGLRLFEELPRTASTAVLLATDLHAGNVLRAQREPWLAIDPKPFVGDPAYDATQHLFNCARLTADPLGLIRRMADLLELDAERIRLWTFARAAAEPGSWPRQESVALARRIAP